MPWPTCHLGICFHHRAQRLNPRRQAEPIKGRRHFFPRLTHRRPRNHSRHNGRCFHGVAFLSWIRHPKPTGSRRATPLHLFQHRPGHPQIHSLAPTNDSIYAATGEEIETRRKAFIRKWRLKHRAVADSLEEAGDRLFTFAQLPLNQWRSVRATNAIERLHEEFKRRIKTQTVLPSADTAAMLFWALLASGQINMRKVDGWQTLATKPIDQPIDLAA